MTEVFLIRHAECEGAGRYIGRGSDPPLTTTGRQTAILIADAVSREKPAAVYCSPLRRAMDTAKPCAEQLGLEVIVLDGLAELDFGAWEGLSWDEIGVLDEHRRRRWIDDPVHVAPPGGERLVQLRERVGAEIGRIVADHPAGRVLVVTHGGPIRSLLPPGGEGDSGAFARSGPDYGGLCRFRAEAGGKPVLVDWNVSLIGPRRTGGQS